MSSDIDNFSIYSGTTGNCTWEYNNSILTISGKGAMENYYSSSLPPWYDYASDIKAVNIQSGVTSVGNNAFIYCKNLNKVTLPDTITSIGFNSFLECSSLTDINIPKNVTYIGSYAFYYCESLKSLAIPSSVTSIGDSTFAGSGLTEITIEKGLISIGNSAFWYCLYLKEITLPESVETIGYRAFDDCPSLEKIIIKNSNCKIYDYSNSISDNTAIIGYENSTAYNYALCFDRYFINIETIASVTLTGDVNHDNTIDSIDATEILIYYANKLIGVNREIDESAADTNKDGDIDSTDAVRVLKYYASSIINKNIGSLEDFFEQ